MENKTEWLQKLLDDAHKEVLDARNRPMLGIVVPSHVTLPPFVQKEPSFGYTCGPVEYPFGKPHPDAAKIEITKVGKNGAITGIRLKKTI